MTQPIPACPHLNGNRFHADDRPLDGYALRDQENAAPPAGAVAEVVPPAADETDALALAATRYLTPTNTASPRPWRRPRRSTRASSSPKRRSTTATASNASNGTTATCTPWRAAAR